MDLFRGISCGFVDRFGVTIASLQCFGNSWLSELLTKSLNVALETNWQSAICVYSFSMGILILFSRAVASA